MKTFRILSSFAGFAAAALAAHAQGLAPTNIANVVFNGTIASATGTANGNGAISTVFTSTGLDYSLSTAGALSDPVAYTYATTGANTATITEPVLGGTGTVSVALTFTGSSSGTFVSTYSAGGTQTGTFSLTPIPAAAPLVNMASRTTLGAGQIAISGIVIGGTAARRVLVRAVGPGLTPLGVTGALTNPSMTFMRGQTQIAANDDWGSDAALQAAFTAAGAFGLPANSKDSAAILTLEPGAYTAFVRGGTAADAGELLIEVYYLN